MIPLRATLCNRAEEKSTTIGKEVVRWPGLELEDDQLEPPGDLRVTTDCRDVLSEIVAHRLGNKHLSSVFLNHTPRFQGVVKAGRAA